MEEMNIKKSNILKTLAVPLMLLAVVLVAAFSHMGSNSQDLPPADGSIFDLIATDDFDFDELFLYNLPVMLHFSASDWCSSCRVMKATLIDLHDELRGNAIVKYIDIDEFMDFAMDFPITVVPTQFLWNSDGTPFYADDGFPIHLLNYSLRATGEHVLTAHEGVLNAQQIIFILESMGMGL